MAFNPNSSDRAIVKEGKLFTGLKNMKVVAINPSKSEMEKLGYKPQNDPVYISTEEEVKKLRLDFFLQGETDQGESIRTKLAFFLENKHRTNLTSTKAEWINDIGRTAWGTPEGPPTDFKWFDHKIARPCKVGEGDVHLFLINWLNIQPGDEAKLDNFEQLFEGNYSELLGLLSKNKNNEIKVLLTVRDGKYQSVYQRYFDRATNKRTTYWESHIRRQTEEGYPPKEDFSNSFSFQEWTEPSVMMDMKANDLNENDVETAEGDPF